ncbi:jacalin-like lectin [Aestuariibacter sp. A3R04]|uniref:jacalin-like lectin n=1 Tax=Aestuariibacter sp. A3R04 TaxID=2841571 RepID=UPI001C087E85|nr:jacalin-like lectin [Aestuariibacter sp. A3R04]MBU3020670.1 hypothetical protein [Aestuariibacter sp. A3R04]
MVTFKKIIFAFVFLGLFQPLHAASKSGNFSTLTYNVAGLLELFSSAPSSRQSATEQISCYVNQFDIVNVQEDFNYHAALYDTCNNHNYRSPTSGGMGIGSGLNTMSYFEFSDIKRIQWEDCSGVDCFTPKGFTMTKLRLEEGVFIDVYNLHTQAETNSAALAARRENIKQLLTYISSHSAGNAVIVMGDANTRYTRAGDNMELFLDRGFKDVWIELLRAGITPESGSNALVCNPQVTSGSCEIVDKVLFKNSRYINLTPVTYEVRQDDENRKGEKLSDHPPVVVDWRYETDSQIQWSDKYGGNGGTNFSDLDALATSNGISKIALRAGRRVDQIQLTFNSGSVSTRGGSGGSLEVLELQSGEYLTSLEICIGNKNGSDRVFYAAFKTNRENRIEGGRKSNECQTITAPQGWQIEGLHGSSGDEIDSLGAIFTKI